MGDIVFFPMPWVLPSCRPFADNVAMSGPPNYRGYRFPPEVISHTVSVSLAKEQWEKCKYLPNIELLEVLPSGGLR